MSRLSLLASAFASSGMGALRHRHAFKDIERYCLFVGYPRSGHTLVGSLLNAHPNFVIAHELDVLNYVRAGFSRVQLFALSIERDRAFTDAGSEWSGYSYAVPGQWQGKFSELKVIGDKKGGMTSLQIFRQPELINRLARTVRVPLRLVHIVRNPFDNIATMHRRSGRDIATCTTRYFEHCRGSAIAMQSVGQDGSVTLRHEDFIADARGSMQMLSSFLGCAGPEDFLSATAALVRPASNPTRASAPWTDAEKGVVNERIHEFPFLEGYSFDA